MWPEDTYEEDTEGLTFWDQIELNIVYDVPEDDEVDIDEDE